MCILAVFMGVLMLPMCHCGMSHGTIHMQPCCCLLVCNSLSEAWCTPPVDQLLQDHSSACLHRTKVVKDNGFNPQWNESFKFKSIFPGLAILCFVVMDDDTLSDDFIEQYSLPLESLARG